jgi:hypothetical protein
MHTPQEISAGGDDGGGYRDEFESAHEAKKRVPT